MAQTQVKRSKKVYDLVVIGGGQRGDAYSKHAQLQPIAIIDPIPEILKNFGDRYGIAQDKRFSELSMLPAPTTSDTICLVSSPDWHHVIAARELVRKGYKWVLMEKPMATNLADCEEIVKLFEDNGVVAGICHVLRGAFSNQTIKDYIPKLGTLLQVRHFEPVGVNHYAHSYVRGNWRNEAECGSSFLLAKCCHDLDLIHWWLGDTYDIESVSSFGHQAYFKKELKPAAVPEHVKRCSECPLKDNGCQFSCYVQYQQKSSARFAHILVPGGKESLTPESLQKVLDEGPYGRCVYECDNDVCDTQQVTINYKDGPIVDFSSAATTKLECRRRTEIYGTKGELISECPTEVVYTNFEDETTTTLKKPDDSSSLEGHGGADGGFIDNFIDSMTRGIKPLTTPNVTIVSHKMSFAAELSRKEKRIVVEL